MVLQGVKIEGQCSGKGIPSEEKRGKKGTEAQVTRAGRTTTLDGTGFMRRGRKRWA